MRQAESTARVPSLAPHADYAPNCAATQLPLGQPTRAPEGSACATNLSYLALARVVGSAAPINTALRIVPPDPPKQTVLFEGRRHSIATSPRCGATEGRVLSVDLRPGRNFHTWASLGTPPVIAEHQATANDPGANTTDPSRHHTVNQTVPPFPSSLVPQAHIHSFST